MNNTNKKPYFHHRQVVSQSPELVSLAAELKERAKELKSRIAPINEFADKLRTEHGVAVDDELVDYLATKQQLLTCYCMNMVFYLYMKVGSSLLMLSLLLLLLNIVLQFLCGH